MKAGISVSLIILIVLCMLKGSAFSADIVTFYHNDPTGSPIAMTDSTGAIVWEAEYKPFGEEFTAGGTAANDRRFIGKEKDEETGLNYFGARYHKAEIGRFLSPDPVGPVDPRTGKINEKILLNPQRLNLYAYGLNNPYRYVDPDGAWAEEIHNTIITNAFSSGGYKLSERQLKALMKGSTDADSSQYQDLAHSYMHAMRAQNQSAETAAALTVSYIMGKVAEYQTLKSKDLDKAYRALGMAMHPLMDATSPSHAGYQAWNGVFPVIDGTTYKAEIHRRRETKTVFISNDNYLKSAVGSIRKLHDDANR